MPNISLEHYSVSAGGAHVTGQRRRQTGERPMTPQEQELIKGLFDRFSQLESQPRDPEAERLIAQGFARALRRWYKTRR